MFFSSPDIISVSRLKDADLRHEFSLWVDWYVLLSAFVFLRGIVPTRVDWGVWHVLHPTCSSHALISWSKDQDEDPPHCNSPRSRGQWEMGVALNVPGSSSEHRSSASHGTMRSNPPGWAWHFLHDGSEQPRAAEARRRNVYWTTHQHPTQSGSGRFLLYTPGVWTKECTRCRRTQIRTPNKSQRPETWEEPPGPGPWEPSHSFQFPFCTMMLKSKQDHWVIGMQRCTTNRFRNRLIVALFKWVFMFNESIYSLNRRGRCHYSLFQFFVPTSGI